MWHRVQGTGFHLKISADCEVTDAMSLRVRRSPVITLRMTTGEQRFEGDTFRIGARGITRIVGAIGASLSKPTGKAIMSRLYDLFPGEPMFREMLGGTVRAAFNADASGECAYFRDIAAGQLAARSFQPVAINVRILRDGVPENV